MGHPFIAECRKCGNIFFTTAKLKKNLLCDTCKQAGCKHEFETTMESNGLRVEQCKKCHLARTIETKKV